MTVVGQRSLAQFPGIHTPTLMHIHTQMHSSAHFYYNPGLGRDQQLQQQLWEISVNIVKDYLTPELLQKYGRPENSQSLERDQEVMDSEEPLSGGLSQEQQQSKPAEADENASDEQEKQHCAT